MLRKACIYDPDDAKNAFFVQFNPNTLEYSAGTGLHSDKRVLDIESTAKEDQQQGDPTGRTGNASLFVRLFCHTYESERSYTDVRADVNRLRAFLRHTDGDGRVHSRKIAFAWGTLTHIGTLERLNVTYQMFASDGTPVQAEISIVISGDDPDVKAAQSNRAAGEAVPKGQSADALLREVGWMFV